MLHLRRKRKPHSMKLLSQSVCFGFCLLAFSSVCEAVPHLVSYQGFVQSQGHAFSGNGHFKFALLGSGGQPVYWRNDGASGPGEPAASVTVPVADGIFTVILGDSGLAGMAAVPPAVFANPDLF